MTGLAYCDAAARIYYDDSSVPLADGGIVREAEGDELIEAPEGTVETMLPGRRPLTTIGPAAKGMCWQQFFPRATRDCSFRPS